MSAVCHQMPFADAVAHEFADDCVCGPTVHDRLDGKIVVHHSLDGRERVELELDFGEASG